MLAFAKSVKNKCTGRHRRPARFVFLYSGGRRNLKSNAEDFDEVKTNELFNPDGDLFRFASQGGEKPWINHPTPQWGFKDKHISEAALRYCHYWVVCVWVKFRIEFLGGRGGIIFKSSV